MTTRQEQLLAELEHTPASDLKRQGWPRIVEAVQRAGRLLVTNHRRHQVVILSIDEYTTLMASAESATAQQEAALEALRARFDERLATLAEPDAGDRLRSLMRHPVRLQGSVKAGDGH